MSSELENSGIRVAVGDCSVTERRRWRPPYQTGKTVHVHAKHYKHNEDGRTAPGVCGNGSVPLSHSGNVVTRIGIHTRSYLPIHRVHNIGQVSACPRYSVHSVNEIIDKFEGWIILVGLGLACQAKGPCCHTKKSTLAKIFTEANE